MFVLLVLALSVPFWVLGAYVSAPAWLPMDLPVAAFQFVVPLVAVAILLARDGGRAGLVYRLGQLMRSRAGGWSGWVATIALVPALLGVTWLVMTMTGRTPAGDHSPLSAAPVLVLVYAVPAACEEIGWAGYAQSRLQHRWGMVSTGLAIGAVWAGWHIVGYVQADRDAVWIVGQCLGTIAVRVLMVWRVSRYGAPAAIVMHTLINVSQSVFPGFTDDGAAAVTYGLSASVITCVAVVAAGLWRRHRTRRERGSSRSGREIRRQTDRRSVSFPTMSRNRAKQADVRRSEIVEAALGLFLAHGYERTTVAGIIEAVGLTKGGFYHHFASKEEVFQACVEQLADSMIDRYRQALLDESLTPRERLHAYLDQAYQPSDSPSGSRVIAEITHRSPSDLQLRVVDGAVQRLLPALSATIDAGRQEGTFAFVGDSESAAVAVLGALRALHRHYARVENSHDALPISVVTGYIEQMLGVRSTHKEESS